LSLDTWLRWLSQARTAFTGSGPAASPTGGEGGNPKLLVAGLPGFAAGRGLRRGFAGEKLLAGAAGRAPTAVMTTASASGRRPAVTTKWSFRLVRSFGRTRAAGLAELLPSW